MTLDDADRRRGVPERLVVLGFMPLQYI